jgi:antitoxin (DNA-binding transcriptional repressor) of toxin-antitoxin stability system
MTETVTTLDVRQRIGDLLNRVTLRQDEFIIERKGKAMAALVPVERLEQMRTLARAHALAVLDRQAEGAGDRLSDDQAMDLALEAQRAARRQLRDGVSRRSRPRR